MSKDSLGLLQKLLSETCAELGGNEKGLQFVRQSKY